MFYSYLAHHQARSRAPHSGTILLSTIQLGLIALQTFCKPQLFAPTTWNSHSSRMSAIDPNRPDIVAFMAIASAALARPLPAPKDVFSFGGSDPIAADERLQLAMEGKKTATTSWPVPDPPHFGVGDLSVILDGKGLPRAVMRTISLVKCRFREVEEEFALAEAEGDYETYRQGHIAFYRDQKNGHEFGEDSMVLCERFEVIYPHQE